MSLLLRRRGLAVIVPPVEPEPEQEHGGSRLVYIALPSRQQLAMRICLWCVGSGQIR
jgi:hypothetical protein